MRFAELCWQRQVKPFPTNLCTGTLPLPGDFWRYESLKSQVFWSLYFTGSNYPPVPSKCVFFPLFTGSKGLEITYFLSIFQLEATWRYPLPHQLAHCDSSVHGSWDMIFYRPVTFGSGDDLKVETPLTQVRKPGKFLILLPIQQNFCLRETRQEYQRRNSSGGEFPSLFVLFL